MAYDPTTVPAALIAQGVGGTDGLRWFGLYWVDPIATVLAPDYITDAVDLGMRVGDSLRYMDTNRGEWDHYDLIVTSINAVTGAATLAFPEVPEEALSLDVAFDAAAADTYVVAYSGGRQVRVDASDFILSGITANLSSQAEAEAGSNNTKVSTPLRVFQAIAAYITGRATKSPPVDADGIVITDSANSGAPKRVTWLNLKAAMFTALGPLIAAATAKSTPVDADGFVIADSAASSAPKLLTFVNLRAWVAGTFVRYDIAQVITAAQQLLARTTIGAILRNHIAGLQVTYVTGNTISISEGEAASFGSPQRLMISAAGVTGLDLSALYGVGSGGRFDTTISDGWWNVFMISNGTTVGFGFSKLLNPTTAPSYPSGYTYYRRAWSVLRSAGAIKSFKHNISSDRNIWDATDSVVNIIVPDTIAHNEGVESPVGFKCDVELDIYLQDNTASTATVLMISDPDGADEAPATAGATLQIPAQSGAALSSGQTSKTVQTDILSQVRYRASQAPGDSTLRISTKAYIDPRKAGY